MFGAVELMIEKSPTIAGLFSERFYTKSIEIGAICSFVSAPAAVVMVG